MVEALRKDKVRVPIAGCSHWRREPEFAAGPGRGRRWTWWTTASSGPPRPSSPRRCKSQLWSHRRGLGSAARRKRHAGLAYVVGQWCPQTGGAWALPHEAADQLLAAATALHEDWDALVRRGVFMFPAGVGRGPGGHGGGRGHLPDPRGGQRQPARLRPLAARRLDAAPRAHGRRPSRRRTVTARPSSARAMRRRGGGPGQRASRDGTRPRPAGGRDALHPGHRRLVRRRDDQLSRIWR